jgi:hypothetical protein
MKGRAFCAHEITLSNQDYDPELITEIFYGGQWFPIERGSYRKFDSSAGLTHIYRDPFSEELVSITEKVTGYKFRKVSTEVVSGDVIHLGNKK